MPCRFMRSKIRKKFKSEIGFGFPVVGYTYDTPWRATKWVVLFKVPRDIYTDNPDFIRCMSGAAKNDPIFLSPRETKYRIYSIRLATGTKNSKQISEALLYSI